MVSTESKQQKPGTNSILDLDLAKEELLSEHTSLELRVSVEGASSPLSGDGLSETRPGRTALCLGSFSNSLPWSASPPLAHHFHCQIRPAATVMMGGLLEGLLLARVHREVDKTRVFAAAKAPKDKKSGKARALNEWTLKNYIDVAHELKWISQPVRDLGSVLRDYRNYIHPEKQRAHGLAFRTEDVSIFWEIAKGICRQLISGSP